MESLFERLRELKQRMGACLEALDGAAPHDDLPQERFAGLNEGLEGLDSASLAEIRDPQQRERLRAELEELMRLNAVLTSTVSRDKERLLELLARSRKARAGAGAQGPTDETGTSCDVRG